MQDDIVLETKILNHSISKQITSHRLSLTSLKYSFPFSFFFFHHQNATSPFKTSHPQKSMVQSLQSILVHLIYLLPKRICIFIENHQRLQITKRYCDFFFVMAFFTHQTLYHPYKNQIANGLPTDLRTLVFTSTQN